MPHTFSKITKTCATRSYWGGNRQVIQSGTMVSVESSYVKGTCQRPGGSWKGMNKNANDPCQQWKSGRH